MAVIKTHRGPRGPKDQVTIFTIKISLLQKSLNAIPAKVEIQISGGFLDPGFRQGDVFF
jgi:hypothetical protein